jgi:hypothetical protein
MTSPKFHKEGNWYVIDEDFTYFSPRYKKHVFLPNGFRSDGASGPAEDIVSTSWFIHDKMCKERKWMDGTPCTAWEASAVLHDILLEEGRWFRARTWFVATYTYERFYVGWK